MKLNLLALSILLTSVSARPQAEGGAPAPPPVVGPFTSFEIVTVTGPAPAPTTPIPNEPVPEPAPPAPLPSTPVNPPGPVPTPPSPVPDPPADGGAANCVCGATYCGKVLVGFQGYTAEVLGTSYCATPNANCATPPTPDSLENTLFVCICNPGEEKGSKIELLCPCAGRCKNDEPDFIGRCETPCNNGGLVVGPGPSLPSSSAAAVPLDPVVPVPLPEPIPASAPAAVQPPSKKGRRL